MTKFIVIENQSKQVSQIIDDSYSISYSGQTTDLEIHEWLNTNLPKNDEIKGFVIELSLGNEDIDTGLLVACHIRLSNFNGLQYLPIYILTNEAKEEIITNQVLDDSVMTSLLLNTPSCNLVKYSNLLDAERWKDTPIQNEKELIENIVNKLRFTDSLDKRHQIANEWGAIRLAQNAGYEISELDYNYPETLYFKYLQKKIKNEFLLPNERKAIVADDFILKDKLDFSFLKFKKILLIDDNADKGWKEVLGNIFGVEIDIRTTLKGVFKNPPNIDIDIVFLDLYMPEDENNSDSRKDLSLKVLEYLKSNYPQIPVIIFTASNKSWTLDEVRNLGADGMYVKESPMFAMEKGYSKENFISFVNTVQTTLDKYAVLRPYWETIVQIKNNLLPEAKQNTPNKFKARIEERLDMFYGLLKKGFEQTDYEKTKFFYSDYELAFMTLWSVLNEISEAYYEKLSIDSSPILNFSTSLHPNGHTIMPIYDTSIWYVKNQPSDKLFSYEWFIETDKYGRLITYNRNYYKIGSRIITNITYNQSLSSFSLTPCDFKPVKSLTMQIGYLIFRKNELLGSSRSVIYLTHLSELSVLRNHLYLTHGDSISSDFYNYTEQEKREQPNYSINPQNDIKKLFELVAYLLTGQEILIEI